MTEKERVFLATKIAFQFLGLPYAWGGDDPVKGFDCSGFCIEILKSVGLLPRKGDWTAAQLWERFAEDQGYSVPIEHISEGCLIFWHGSDPNRIIHIEYALNDELSIGASGGGSKTLTQADAINQNAYIKVRPFKSRAGIYGAANPFGHINPFALGDD